MLFRSQTTKVRLLMGREQSLTISPFIISVSNSPMTGTDTITVSAPSTTLSPGVRYYYAFEASNASGITRSPVRSNVLFLAPVIKSNSTASITTSGVQLRAVMNAGASNTRNSFIWGTDPNLLTGTTEVSGTPFAVTNALDTTITVNLTGLKAATTYYFRSKIIAYTGPLQSPLLGPIQKIGRAHV